MELFKSLKDKTKSYEVPFKHFELNEPLTNEAIKEICKADVLDPKKANLNWCTQDCKSRKPNFHMSRQQNKSKGRVLHS